MILVTTWGHQRGAFSFWTMQSGKRSGSWAVGEPGARRGEGGGGRGRDAGGPRLRRGLADVRAASATQPGLKCEEKCATWTRPAYSLCPGIRGSLGRTESAVTEAWGTAHEGGASPAH